MLRVHVIFCHWPAQQRPVANGSCEVKSGGLSRTVENQHSKGHSKGRVHTQLLSLRRWNPLLQSSRSVLTLD
jgi:hypothetical protein